LPSDRGTVEDSAASTITPESDFTEIPDDLSTVQGTPSAKERSEVGDIPVAASLTITQSEVLQAELESNDMISKAASPTLPVSAEAIPTVEGHQTGSDTPTRPATSTTTRPATTMNAAELPLLTIRHHLIFETPLPSPLDVPSPLPMPGPSPAFASSPTLPHFTRMPGSWPVNPRDREKMVAGDDNCLCFAAEMARGEIFRMRVVINLLILVIWVLTWGHLVGWKASCSALHSEVS
jgi:hypothetical protein